jgi:hypothetical protein
LLITAYLSQLKSVLQPDRSRYTKWGYRLLLIGLIVLLVNILLLYLLAYYVFIPYIERGGSLDRFFSTWSSFGQGDVHRPVSAVLQDVGLALRNTRDISVAENTFDTVIYL